MDSNLPLIEYNARFLSSKLGRFIQPDTTIPGLANSQAWNRFSYNYNNPINFVDPSGHFPQEPPSNLPCPDGDCSLFPPPEDGGGGDSWGSSSDQPGDIDGDVNGNNSTSEITGFVFYGEAGAKVVAFLPVFLFSHNRGSVSPFGVACIMKGRDAGKCIPIASLSGGKGLNLPGIAEGSVDGGFSLLLNTYELKDVEGVDFEIGVEVDIQALAEIGVGVSYSRAIDKEGHFAKDYKGDQIGALNFELGAGVDAKAPGIDASVFAEYSVTTTWGMPMSICRVISQMGPVGGINPSCGW